MVQTRGINITVCKHQFGSQDVEKEINVQTTQDNGNCGRKQKRIKVRIPYNLVLIVFFIYIKEIIFCGSHNVLENLLEYSLI